MIRLIALLSVCAVLCGCKTRSSEQQQAGAKEFAELISSEIFPHGKIVKIRVIPESNVSRVWVWALVENADPEIERAYFEEIEKAYFDFEMVPAEAEGMKDSKNPVGGWYLRSLCLSKPERSREYAYRQTWSPAGDEMLSRIERYSSDCVWKPESPYWKWCMTKASGDNWPAWVLFYIPIPIALYGLFFFLFLPYHYFWRGEGDDPEKFKAPGIRRETIDLDWQPPRS